MNFSDRVRRIIRLASIGRLESASCEARELLPNIPSDLDGAEGATDLGTMHWTKHGDGLQAREYWLKAAQIFEQLAGNPKSRAAYGNCCENMMLHALSFEEYAQLADCLSCIRPEEPILKLQLPKLMDMRVRGLPWHHAAHDIAMNYIRVEAGCVSGQPPCGASILQLLLEHRQAQRLPRDVWRKTLLWFVPARQLVAAAAYRGAIAAGFPETSAEVQTCFTGTMRYLEQYTATFPGDPQIAKMTEMLDESLTSTKIKSSARPWWKFWS